MLRSAENWHGVQAFRIEWAQRAPGKCENYRENGAQATIPDADYDMDAHSSQVILQHADELTGIGTVRPGDRLC